MALTPSLSVAGLYCIADFVNLDLFHLKSVLEVLYYLIIPKLIATPLSLEVLQLLVGCFNKPQRHVAKCTLTLKSTWWVSAIECIVCEKCVLVSL